MDNLLQFRPRTPATPITQLRPTEDLDIYLDVLMHMRNHAICHNDQEFVKQLEPIIEQGLASGEVYATVQGEPLKARVRKLLDGKQDFFFWKMDYEKSVNE